MTPALIQEMKLVHYTKRSLYLSELYSKEQLGHANEYIKPRGLWVSVESASSDWTCWRSWCEGKRDFLDKFEYGYQVKLHRDAKIKLITNASDLEEFHKEFTGYRFVMKGYEFYGLDWNSASKIYQGVIIAPYIQSMRHSETLRWYYAWDCASGCIWDISAVKELVEVKDFKKPQATQRS